MKFTRKASWILVFSILFIGIGIGILVITRRREYIRKETITVDNSGNSDNDLAISINYIKDIGNDGQSACCLTQHYISIYEKHKTMSNINKCVIADCGSTGTRIIYYEWQGNDPSTIEVVDYTVIPSSYTDMHHMPRISAYARGVSDILMTLRGAGRNHLIPTYFLCTAGMRLLTPAQQEYHLVTISNELSRLAPHFVITKNSIRIITGLEEGLNSWIAVNILKGSLTYKQPPNVAHSPTHHSLDNKFTTDIKNLAPYIDKSLQTSIDDDPTLIDADSSLNDDLDFIETTQSTDPIMVTEEIIEDTSSWSGFKKRIKLISKKVNQIPKYVSTLYINMKGFNSVLLELVGMVELGGASAQIAYPICKELAAKYVEDDDEFNNVYELKITPYNTTAKPNPIYIYLYVSTKLGYGSQCAMKAWHEDLAEYNVARGKNVNDTIIDPCFPKGLSPDIVSTVGCMGGGNWHQCQRGLNKFLSKTDKPIGHKQVNPKWNIGALASDKNNLIPKTFVGMSLYYYVNVALRENHIIESFDVNEFTTYVESLLTAGWANTEAVIDKHYEPHLHEIMRQHICTHGFKAAWVLNILYNVLSVSSNPEDPKYIDFQFVGNINGKELSWTYGVVIVENMKLMEISGYKSVLESAESEEILKTASEPSPSSKPKRQTTSPAAVVNYID